MRWCHLPATIQNIHCGSARYWTMYNEFVLLTINTTKKYSEKKIIYFIGVTCLSLFKIGLKFNGIRNMTCSCANSCYCIVYHTHMATHENNYAADIFIYKYSKSTYLSISK